MGHKKVVAGGFVVDCVYILVSLLGCLMSILLNIMYHILIVICSFHYRFPIELYIMSTGFPVFLFETRYISCCLRP